MVSYMPNGSTFSYSLLFAFWISSAFLVFGATAPVPAHCVLSHKDDRYQGSCGRLFDQAPVLTLRPEPAMTTGVWRADIHPASVWAGEMTDEGSPNAPIELEIYTGGWGVLRTEYGWFGVTQFVSSPTLSFDLDSSHEVSPNALDRKIVREAAEILSKEALWNRADNRKCAATAKTYSIYCAMEKATIDVTGGFNHRRPALESVRVIVDERTQGRNYHHRLMDYNNDPATHLGDVQTLFQEALTRMDQP
jgi:hypothetical protein